MSRDRSRRGVRITTAVLTILVAQAVLHLTSAGCPLPGPGGSVVEAAEVSASSAPARPPLEVIYLANEGYLLRSGGDVVLIDGFVEEPYSIYRALPKALAADLAGARGMFSEVDLALASHPHRDHFQPGIAGRFLRSTSTARLVSSPQVVEAVVEELGAAAKDLGDRLEAHWPVPGTAKEVEHGGASVTLFRLRHGGERNYGLHNLGQVMEVGGWRIAHVGDAEMLAASFEPFADELADLDVALIPYWFLYDGPGPAIVERFLGATRQIAAHIPDSDLEGLRKGLAEEGSEVVILAEPLEKLVLEDEVAPAPSKP